jgi:hypothetical protein
MRGDPQSRIVHRQVTDAVDVRNRVFDRAKNFVERPARFEIAVAQLRPRFPQRGTRQAVLVRMPFSPAVLLNARQTRKFNCVLRGTPLGVEIPFVGGTFRNPREIVSDDFRERIKSPGQVTRPAFLSNLWLTFWSHGAIVSWLVPAFNRRDNNSRESQSATHDSRVFPNETSPEAESSQSPKS